MSPSCKSRKGSVPLRIYLHSRNSIVACSMKQMHISLRSSLRQNFVLRTQLRLSYVCVCIYKKSYTWHMYIHIYTNRARVHWQYTLQDTLWRRVFTYQSDDGLVRIVELRYSLIGNAMARTGGICRAFSHPSIADLSSNLSISKWI